MNYSFLDEYESVKITPPPKTIDNLKNNIYYVHRQVCTNKTQSYSYEIFDVFRSIQCIFCKKNI
jgi:hypothetical protein